MAEKQYVVFELEAEEYGIDILNIHEINRLKEISISKVPKTPDFIEGIINLRGEVVPVIDLRKKFSLDAKAIEKESRIVIVKLKNKVVGLLVDSVSHVITLSDEDISPPPEEVKVNSEYIVGLGKKNDRMIFILDIYKILDVKEEDALQDVV